MTTLVYLVAYAGTLACAGVIALKALRYMKKPMHVRWELYPVPHEPGERGVYGGSYLEDADWWKEKRASSFIAGMKALLIELLFLHSTFEHNTKLWYRTYPFHCGLYLLLGGILFTLIAALAELMDVEPGIFLTAVGNIVQVLSCVGFLAIIGGACALLYRRLHQEDLRKYSTREHYMHLGAFILLGLSGLLAWLCNPSFFELGRTFMANMLTFRFTAPDSCAFTLYLLLGFLMAAYVPATHMGHFFMKAFLYHDIRWGDEPSRDNPNTRERIKSALGFHVSWQAPHIKGDGRKTWAEVATTNPTANPDAKE
jgi:nitrate reductase gamma subunit